MKKLLCVASFLFIATACNQVDKSDVLPPEKMEGVLLDMQIAEVYSTIVDDSEHYVTNNNMDSLARYYNDIYRHHNVTPEVFAKSIAWYKRNPDKLDSVYNNIIPKLTKLETRYPVQ